MPLLHWYVAALLLAPVLGALLLWWLHLWFWRRRLEVARDYALEEDIVLPDGGVITLRRLPAPSHASPTREGADLPLLMVHGLAMNHRNHDACDQTSFARFMRQRGRDVWLLTLRSGRSRPSLFGPKHCHFDAMVQHDIPIAVQTILARTGKARLDYVGFSMGGMLLFGSLDRTLDSRLIRRAALIGSPAQLQPLSPFAPSRYLPLRLTLSVPMRLIMRTWAFAPRFVSRVLWRRLYNADNIERAIERRMLWNVWEDIPGRLAADFVRWSRGGGEFVVLGKPVLPGLTRVAVPACFFAGSADRLAPVWSVRAGYETWGCALPNPNKQLVVLGREHGARADYGHCDLIFGRYAREEVFEPAARFLDTGAFTGYRTLAPPAAVADDRSVTAA
jgi:polyhydroxyalkanoate synthase